MTDTTPIYKVEYDAFITNYKKVETGGAEVGEMIARMAQYFTDFNIECGKAEIEFNKIASLMEQQTDENGKSLSSTKAKTIADASKEKAKLLMLRVHISNIEQSINALKSLQKGILNEYSHMGSA